jgi:hypothetical protein
MLVRIKLMIKYDIWTYLGLFLIFMPAGSIALNSVLYPYYPFGFELIKRVIVNRGLMTLFASDKQDLEHTTESCRSQTNVSQSYTCDVGLVDYGEKLRNYNISEECNYQSTFAWMILIQYFFLVKIILASLLTAMFSATGQRINAISEQIWMFQRYEIILEYEFRATLPPPFTLFCYAYRLIIFLVRLCKSVKICCKKTVLKKEENQEKRKKPLHYWKNLARTYAKQYEKEELEKHLKDLKQDLKKIERYLQKNQPSSIQLSCASNPLFKIYR